ncbi:actin-binding FH2 [Tanacetum coccineum]
MDEQTWWLNDLLDRFETFFETFAQQQAATLQQQLDAFHVENARMIEAYFEAIAKKEQNIPKKEDTTLSLPSEEVSPVVKDFLLDNGEIKMEAKNRGFDMKVAWDDPENKQIDLEDVNLEKEINKIKNHFELNPCLTKDDGLIVCEFDKSSSENMKTITMDIDLEVHVVPEAEEKETINEVKKINDFDFESVEKMAAEAMVAMNGIFNQQDQVGSTSEVVADLPEKFQGDMVALARVEHKSGKQRGVWDPGIKIYFRHHLEDKVVVKEWGMIRPQFG